MSIRAFEPKFMKVGVLTAALHPSEADVPPEAMLDPVANTIDLRKPFDKDRARRVEAALKANRIGLSDIGDFNSYG